MNTKKPDSDDVLRAIDDLGAEASHTAEESRAALEDAGIDADRLVRSVRDDVRSVLAVSRRTGAGSEMFRNVAIGAMAASALFFVISFHFTSRASADANRELARAQLISPLLPALTSDDPDRRSMALVVARQVDPLFASETAARLSQWEVSTQALARASRNSTYATRILAGLRKLELSRDPDDRKVAIWNDLLPVLQEARRNRDDFVDVAIAYERVLPLLRVGNPDVFLDSYWGELWILNILLDSRIASVVDAARAQAPAPTVVQNIFQKNAASLPERDRHAFEEAIAAYENTLKAVR